MASDLPARGPDDYIADGLQDDMLKYRQQVVQLASISRDLSNMPPNIDVAVLCHEQLRYRSAGQGDPAELLLTMLSLTLIPYSKHEGQPVGLDVYFLKTGERVKYSLYVGETTWLGVLPFFFAMGGALVRTRYSGLSPDIRA